jgi:hypothetical protein
MFRKLVIKKNPPINKCGECKTFLKRLERAKRDDVSGIRRERAGHWADVRLGRAVYKRAKTRANDNSDYYGCIIIDGMDQAKTNVPGADGTREDMEAGKAVCPVRLIGCIVAGYFIDMYICPADVPHDSNTTLTIRMSAISRYDKSAVVHCPNLCIFKWIIQTLTTRRMYV